MVSITLRVLSRPDVKHLSKIYQNLGLDYDERVLPSIGNEVLKSIVAQFDAAELITQREVVIVFIPISPPAESFSSRSPLASGKISCRGRESSVYY
jgi:hypothetical protein